MPVLYLGELRRKSGGEWVEKPSVDKPCQCSPRWQGEAGVPAPGKSSLLL